MPCCPNYLQLKATVSIFRKLNFTKINVILGKIEAFLRFISKLFNYHTIFLILGHCEGHSPNKSNTLDGTGNTSIAPSTSVKVVTSTPRKKKISSNSMKKEKMMEVEPILLEMSGEAESMPQLYPSHYFNIFNIFGVGKANYKVASVEENHKKYLIKNYYEPKNVPLQYVHNPNPNNNSKHQANSPTHDESTIALVNK